MEAVWTGGTSGGGDFKVDKVDSGIFKVEDLLVETFRGGGSSFRERGSYAKVLIF